MDSSKTGRIDVHSHLLPGVDDGCRDVNESIACARRLVDAGYTHSFCTPHIWPGLPENRRENIGPWTWRLQDTFDAHGVPLELTPGGEINLTPDYYLITPPEQVVTYGMKGRYCLFDIWADRLPEHFEPSVRWFQKLGIQPILAHPERMKAVQDDPAVADYFTDIGLLLQGNLQCFADPPGSATRTVATRYLLEGRYFMVGCDLHRIESLEHRMSGLKVVEELAGPEGTHTLTVSNPMKLLE